MNSDNMNDNMSEFDLQKYRELLFKLFPSTYLKHTLEKLSTNTKNSKSSETNNVVLRRSERIQKK